MSARENGGPAFPRNPHSGEPSDDGMTLRDYFAAKALQAMSLPADGIVSNGTFAIRVAQYAYDYADAMLKARDA